MSKFPSEIILRNDHKIVFVVMDGRGGLPLSKGGQTEMEAAKTPNLDKFTSDNKLNRQKNHPLRMHLQTDQFLLKVA